ncbi:MAG: hypothetical protein IIX11_04310 [Selenomonadales bacterium]|nr:hypothetical protein [Selenomonadales bacterium]
MNFAASDTVLILYIDVERYADGDETKYRICNCRGGEVREPELWQMNEVEGRYILQYYPSQEMIEQVWQLMYAFNREDTDIYDCIVIDDDPMIKEEGDRGWGLNSVFYGRLFSMHRQYGDMKLGYVCFDDMTYSVAPYIEGFGFFVGIRVVGGYLVLSVSGLTTKNGKRRILSRPSSENRMISSIISPNSSE